MALATLLASEVSPAAQVGSPETPTPAPAAAVDPFESAPPLQAERLRGLRPEIARAILRGEPGGEIALATLASPLPPAGDRAPVALFVEIDGGTFLDANQASLAPVEVYAYALGPGGSVAAYLAEAFTLDVTRHGEAVWNGGVRFIGWLELPPGDYELRVMVRNARSLAHGLVFSRLDVPAAAADALPSPLFPEPRLRRSWLPVRGRAGWPPQGDHVYPFAVDGRPLVPAARPVLVGGRPSRALLFPGPLAAAPAGGAIDLLAVAPSAPQGEPELVASVPIESLAAADGTGTPSPIGLRFVTPEVPPGSYALRVRLDGPDGPLATSTLAVLVIDVGPQDRELLWTDLKSLGHAGQPAVAVAPIAEEPKPARLRRPAGRRAARRLAGRYRQAVAAAAAGGPRPTALLEFETAVLTRGGNAPLEQLRAAELAVAVEIGRDRPELLLPLVAIHDEVFHLYRRRHLFSLVSHTRRLIEALAELYAELGGERETAAGILASVGGYMQEMRAPGDSRRLFGRALAIHPEHPAALLALGASYEKYGEYGQAVQRLERLVAARPELTEARLRLAINLERIGDRQRFREILREIARGDEGGWVTAVACQELARSLLETGALDEAAALLEGALERLPDRQELWILLAHVRDRQGRLAGSWDSLQRVTAAPDRRSDRLTYDDWANGPLERARRALAERAAGLRPDLGAAVGP